MAREIYIIYQIYDSCFGTLWRPQQRSTALPELDDDDVLVLLVLLDYNWLITFIEYQILPKSNMLGLNELLWLLDLCQFLSNTAKEQKGFMLF